MAQKATIFKAELDISDMDRHYYASHALTLARHPSETDERMMVRLLAFALNADEQLSFSEGMDNPDDPALWRKDLTGSIEQWIDLGQPDDKRLLRACGRAEEVLVYCYSTAAPIWWDQAGPKLERAKNLRVFHFPNTLSLRRTEHQPLHVPRHRVGIHQNPQGETISSAARKSFIMQMFGEKNSAPRRMLTRGRAVHGAGLQTDPDPQVSGSG